MKPSDIVQLRSLLARYYAAETTPQEESRLRELLTAPGLPDEFVPDREMMLSVEAIQPPVGFGQRLADRIDTLAASSASPVVKARRRPRRVVLLRWCAAAAAVIIIAVTAFTRVPSATATPTPLTPEETYEQMEMALTLFSETISKGYAALGAADAIDDEAAENYSVTPIFDNL